MMGKHYIGGSWVASRMGRTRSIINPANGEVIAEVAEGEREDARAAISSARAAFEEGKWAKSTYAERARVLRSIAEQVIQHRDELAEFETLNTGITLRESQSDMEHVADVFRYYADLAEDDPHEALQSPNPGTTSELVREPAGVCALILPWNYPLVQASWKLAPALAAGCAIVMKPSELTPLTALRLTEIVMAAGVPEGVVNLVLGAGDPVGAELVEHEQVDLVSFTGGIATGKAIMATASETVKRVALELGGKNPNIIFDDADFDVAVDYALNAVFFHAGQICSAGARLMVHDALHDRFVDALVARMKQIRLGPGLDASSEMGPLISADHRDKVEAWVALANEEGACPVLGGRRPDDPKLRSGFFYEPTIFTQCTRDMRVVREEIFGPVITVERFHSEEEVVRDANNTIYGLSAGIWTRDRDRIRRVTRALRFGTVWVNDFNVYFPQAPWGGFKRSGLGRELGRAGLDEYTELKHIYENHEAKALQWFGAAALPDSEP